jgi:hypothetical protein
MAREEARWALGARVQGCGAFGRVYGQFMDRDQTGELQGQTSIFELLDEPAGTAPIQLVLPIYVQLRPGEFRRLS